MKKIMYPFIDLAVHDAIRKPFLDGKALAIVTPNFETLLWANGSAANFFKFETIYDLMDQGLIKSKKTRKKLRATAKQLINNKVIKTADLRILPKGDGTELDLSLELITLPKGEQAILVTINKDMTQSHDTLDIDHIIAGFANTGTCVAVLGNDGQVLGATEQLIALDIDLYERRRITEEATSEIDRLVKRPIETSKGDLPSAIGHLSDDPDMYLLFVIDDNLEAFEEITDVELSVENQEESLSELSHEEIEILVDDPATELVPETNIDTDEMDNTEVPTEHGPTPLTSEDTATDDLDLIDDTPFTFDPKRRAVRFVWRTDAAAIFTEISTELGDAVGPNAANVLGRRFGDVALVFNLNPSEEIIDLIRRRDTWSGKTVMWPVQGTDLSVPVDLAALPTYTRDRLFDGYRGFGVARIQDAIHDPEAIGFALVSGPHKEGTSDIYGEPKNLEIRHENIIEQVENDAPSIEDDPYRGEVPALQTSEAPRRRQNDKIVHLDELRREAREKLTEDEQAAFFEIREKLSKINSDFNDSDDLEDELSADKEETLEGIGSEETDIGNDSSLDDTEHETTDDLQDKNSDETADLEEAEIRSEAHTDVDDAPIAPEIGSDNYPASVDIIDEDVATLIYKSDVLLFANETFFDLTGYTNIAQLSQLGGLDHLFIEDTQQVILDDDDTHRDDELVIRCADGQHLAVKSIMHFTRWQDEKALRLTFDVLSDSNLIGKTDAGENERLKTKISDLSSILETATDGVVIIDEHGHIQSINSSASALFDYDGKETEGEPFAMLFASESQKSVLDYVNAMAEHGVKSILNDGREVIGRVSSGGTLPLSMTIGRLAGSGGYCAVLRDITQSRHAEDELRNAKRDADTASSHKSDFLARVSHEIRTPLNAIIGFSDLISQERFGPAGHPRYVEYAHDISKSGRHVLDIVNDLLDISKIEAGQQELDFQSVNLNNEINEALSIMQQIANEKRVVTRSSLPSDVPNVVADQRSIRQILLNVLSNSIRFTPAGGQIVVSTSIEASGHVLLRVRDNGIGMSRTELERAMQPFGQVEQETRQRGEGTGLGLPLTKAMTEANRAMFDIISSPGEGTLVTINFPPQRVLAE